MDAARQQFVGVGEGVGGIEEGVPRAIEIGAPTDLDVRPMTLSIEIRNGSRWHGDFRPKQWWFSMPPAGFNKIRVATTTPFNLILEAKA